MHAHTTHAFSLPEVVPPTLIQSVLTEKFTVASVCKKLRAPKKIGDELTTTKNATQWDPALSVLHTNLGANIHGHHVLISSVSLLECDDHHSWFCCVFQTSSIISLTSTFETL